MEFGRMKTENLLEIFKEIEKNITFLEKEKEDIKSKMESKE